MNFDPQKFFIGLMDFFSILLPGALLTCLLMREVGPAVLGDRYAGLAGAVEARSEHPIARSIAESRGIGSFPEALQRTRGAPRIAVRGSRCRTLTLQLAWPAPRVAGWKHPPSRSSRWL